ncbi:MAG: hypothetical protein D8B38_04635 [Candidatus Saccharimonas sp.]|nr:MAG: hypothetical protein D8B38_04635 [Candidatus Saccharimonas sp.]
MILLGSALANYPVMSLQMGGKVGSLAQPLVDPATLTIVAYTVNGSFANDTTMLLRLADVREMSELGMIIDSVDELITPTDVIKIQRLYELKFHLLGMTVQDKRGRRLGKISDYTIETGNFVIQQLIVRRSWLHRLNDAELVIHRSQIIEINNDAIIVQSQAETKKPEQKATQPAMSSGEYVNPFRKPSQARESIKTDERR